MNDQNDATVSEVPGVVVSPIGGMRRSGRTALRPRTTVVTLIGGLDLDLTDATLPPAGARLTKLSLVGGVRVIAPPDVRVEVGGFSLVGPRTVERVGDAPADARVLRISAWSIVGGVRVRVAR